MFRKTTTILLLLLILTSVIHVKPIAAQENFSRSVTVYFPAVIVTKTSNETILIKAVVTVTDGTGRVTVTGAPVDRLFRLSAEASAIISSFIYNFNYWVYDYTIDISLNRTTTVAGPSGSLALAIAYYSAVAGIDIDDKVITSGMINPDGTIGQVSYIKEKAAGIAEDFEKFLFPLDQDVLRINVTTQKRIGPYPIGVTRPVVEQLDLNIGNLTSHTAGSIFEAAELSLNLNRDWFLTSPNIPQIMDENLTLVSQELYNVLLYETLKKSDEIMSTLDILVFRSRALEYEVNATLETANSIIALSWLSLQEGRFFSSIEILLQAYLRLKYTEYLLGLLLNDFRTSLIEQDVRSEVFQAYILINETEVSSLEALKTKSYAKMLLIEAANLFDTAGPMLKYIDLARAEKLLRAAEEGAIKMAQAKTLAKKSTILQNLASSMNGAFSVEEDDAYMYAGRYVQAVKTIYLYAYEVSLATEVFSPFIAQAGYNLANAERNIDQDPLLAMTYAAETYFYISTYMALHPGYQQITSFRLPYIQNTTWSMIEFSSELNTPIVPWIFSQHVDVLTTNSSIIMSYEKALSHLILDRIIARDYNSGQVYTKYKEWLMADEIEIDQPQQVFPWANVLACIIPVLLLGSLISVNRKINPLRRLFMFLSRS